MRVEKSMTGVMAFTARFFQRIANGGFQRRNIRQRKEIAEHHPAAIQDRQQLEPDE
jgi:hypothetical protein